MGDSMKPNIIFYFSDQQRWDTVNEKLTPNLMKLAGEGIFYENAFTCQPVCGPARACLQTGVYATENGSFRNGIPLCDDIKPLAEYFNENGYKTAYIGKWHLASGKGFSCETSAIPGEKRGGYKDYWRAADVLEFTSHGYDGYVFDGDNNKIEFKGYRADCINDFALDFIDKTDSSEPFFMFISQIEPHHQNDHKRYEGFRETVESYKDYPIPEDLSFLKGDYESCYPDYLSCINRLDYNVGRLADKLREKGIYDNTVIIYTSDHGSHFRTRNSEYKRSCHDSCTHIPMIISGGAFKGGKKYDGLVSLIDIPPTLLDIAEIEIPESYKGIPLSKTISGEAIHDEVFIQISESQVGRCIRTKKYKYSVRAFAQGWLNADSKHYFEDYLYDLENDPCEKNNLVRSAYYKGVRLELRKKLQAQMVKANEEAPKIYPNPMLLYRKNK